MLTATQMNLRCRGPGSQATLTGRAAWLLRGVCIVDNAVDVYHFTDKTFTDDMLIWLHVLTVRSSHFWCFLLRFGTNDDSCSFSGIAGRQARSPNCVPGALSWIPPKASPGVC